MWAQDNYLWPWLHDLTPPRAVTHSYQHFNQQTRHSANYCSIMIILLMLANVYVCFPLCCRVEACLCYYSSDDTTSSLVVSQSAHILSRVIRTILPRRGEDRTSIINFCLLEIHLALTRKICYSRSSLWSLNYFFCSRQIWIYLSIHHFTRLDYNGTNVWEQLYLSAPRAQNKMDKIWNISSIYQLNMNLVKKILVNIKDETES